MNVYVVFSLNGVDDTIRVVSKNVLEIISHPINMNEKICSNFIAVSIIFRIIV